MICRMVQKMSRMVTMVRASDMVTCVQQPSRNAQRGRLEVVPDVSSTDLSHHNSSYCFLGGVVLGHNVQHPTDDELQEKKGKIPSGNG